MHDRTIFLNEGMEAGLDGFALNGCPYVCGSKEHAMWVEGWKCAVSDDVVPAFSAEFLSADESPSPG
jgi:ribosome modulation factor